MRGGPRAGQEKPKAIPAYHRRCAQLNKEFLASGDGMSLVRGRAAAVDELVLAAYRRHLWFGPDEPPAFCLAAIGGYGREELFPHSDVDLLLLFARQVGQVVPREHIAAFLRELWDSGLRLGHSTRLLSECGTLDPRNTEGAIALLDARFLAGDINLFEKLRSETLPRLVSRERTALLRSLGALAELRYNKFGGTIYHLEPDVKESPGGLRDHHLICWLAAILRADEKDVPLGSEVPEGARREILAAREFLAATRAHLHLLGGRDVNLLTFDMQQQVAQAAAATADFRAIPLCGISEWSALPYEPLAHPAGPDGSVESPQPEGRATSPEQWMRLYFQHARSVFRLAGQLLRQASTPRSSLFHWFEERKERLSNADFVIHSGEAFLRNPIGAQRDPGLWLDLFEFQARHSVALSIETEHRLQRQLGELADWARQTRDLWPRFRRILALPHAYTALASMHELGLLGALFPEFRLIESLVIRDLYHKYTVDEHSLLTIKHLHELKAAESGNGSAEKHEPQPESGQPESRFADLLAELEQPQPLFLALLFHDLGKSEVAQPSGRAEAEQTESLDHEASHVPASVRLTDSILARLEMDETERETVRFLVENHLLISSLMGSRDIADPATARELAARVETGERLKMLCLLTFADIKSVNPTALTPWKQETLWQFYVAAHNELSRRLDSDRTTPGEAAMVFRPEVVQFLEGFPRRYLKTHSPAEILSHFRLAEELGERGVRLSLTRRQGHYRLLMLTGDHPFLFAAVTGTLAAFGMNILKAEAFSNKRGTVLDTFVFDDLHRSLELNPDETDRLLATLEGAIAGQVDVAKLIEGRLDRAPLGRASYSVETRLRFDRASSGASTLLEVVTRDRPGLLYRISNVLSAQGCNIEIVLVDTQGHKAIDVFYITRRGGPLDEPWQAAVEKELRRVLE